MNAIKIMAIILIIAGQLSLIYGGFSYSREIRKNQESELGSVEAFVKDTRTVSVPVWASIGTIIAGGLLLTLANKKDQH